MQSHGRVWVSKCHSNYPTKQTTDMTKVQVPNSRMYIYLYMYIFELNTLDSYANSSLSLLPQHKANTHHLHWNVSKLQADHILRHTRANVCGDNCKSHFFCVSLHAFIRTPNQANNCHDQLTNFTAATHTHIYIYT